MNYGKLFAYAIAVLSFAASIGYAAIKNWRMSCYWLFAGALTLTVTINN